MGKGTSSVQLKACLKPHAGPHNAGVLVSCGLSQQRGAGGAPRQLVPGVWRPTWHRPRPRTVAELQPPRAQPQATAGQVSPLEGAVSVQVLTGWVTGGGTRDAGSP